ncbi:cycle-inhibiting factor (plasmid) [Burkholderia sp. MS455]|uniref:cycle-inhibiting factor n=1 Tax=Burkholderia sp. MS455 TaxID=2811788 RepID=UPI0019588AE5|nr:cycle-inhibiting factor [Burkholderia sp. MS455]QRR11855.1 cycle-inhibiting factor [Burkholderia sp. MS455]
MNPISIQGHEEASGTSREGRHVRWAPLPGEVDESGSHPDERSLPRAALNAIHRRASQEEAPAGDESTQSESTQDESTEGGARPNEGGRRRARARRDRRHRRQVLNALVAAAEQALLSADPGAADQWKEARRVSPARVKAGRSLMREFARAWLQEALEDLGGLFMVYRQEVEEGIVLELVEVFLRHPVRTMWLAQIDRAVGERDPQAVEKWGQFLRTARGDAYQAVSLIPSWRDVVGAFQDIWTTLRGSASQDRPTSDEAQADTDEEKVSDAGAPWGAEAEDEAPVGLTSFQMRPSVVKVLFELANQWGVVGERPGRESLHPGRYARVDPPSWGCGEASLPQSDRRPLWMSVPEAHADRELRSKWGQLRGVREQSAWVAQWTETLQRWGVDMLTGQGRAAEGTPGQSVPVNMMPLVFGQLKPVVPLARGYMNQLLHRQLTGQSRAVAPPESAVWGIPGASGASVADHRAARLSRALPAAGATAPVGDDETMLRYLNKGLTLAEYLVKHGSAKGFVWRWPALLDQGDEMGAPLRQTLLEAQLKTIFGAAPATIGVQDSVTYRNGDIVKDMSLLEAMAYPNGTLTYPSGTTEAVTTRLEQLRLADADTQWAMLIEHAARDARAQSSRANAPILNPLSWIDQWVRRTTAAEQARLGMSEPIAPDQWIEVGYRLRIAANVQPLHHRVEPTLTKRFQWRELATGWHQPLLVQHEIVSYGGDARMPALVEAVVGQVGGLEAEMQQALKQYRQNEPAKQAAQGELTKRIQTQALTLLDQPGVNEAVRTAVSDFLKQRVQAQHGLTYRGQRLLGVYYLPVGSEGVAGILFSAHQDDPIIIRQGTRTLYDNVWGTSSAMSDAILPFEDESKVRKWLAAHIALSAAKPEMMEKPVDYDVTTVVPLSVLSVQIGPRASGKLKADYPIAFGESKTLEQLPAKLREDLLTRLESDIDTLLYTKDELHLAQVGHLLSHLSTLYRVAGIIYGPGASWLANLLFWGVDSGVEVGAAYLQRAGAATVAEQKTHDEQIRQAIRSSVASLVMILVPPVVAVGKQAANEAIRRIYTADNLHQAIEIYNLFKQKHTSFATAFRNMRWSASSPVVRTKVLRNELVPFAQPVLGAHARGEASTHWIDALIDEHGYDDLADAVVGNKRGVEAQARAYGGVVDLIQDRIATPLPKQYYVAKVGEPFHQAAQWLTQQIEATSFISMWVDSYTLTEAQQLERLLIKHLHADLSEATSLDGFLHDFWGYFGAPTTQMPLKLPMQRALMHQTQAQIRSLGADHRAEILYELILGISGDERAALVALTLARLQANPGKFYALSHEGMQHLTRVGKHARCKRAVPQACVSSTSVDSSRPAVEQRVLARDQTDTAMPWRADWQHRIVDHDPGEIIQQARTAQADVRERIQGWGLSPEQQSEMMQAYGVEAPGGASATEPVSGIRARDLFKLTVEEHGAVDPTHLPAVSGDDKVGALLDNLDIKKHYALLVDDARLGLQYLVVVGRTVDGYVASVMQSNLGETLPALQHSDWMRPRARSIMALQTLKRLLSSGMKDLPIDVQDALLAHVLDLNQNTRTLVRESNGKTIVDMTKPVSVQGMEFDPAQQAINVGILERKMAAHLLARELERHGEIRQYLAQPALQHRDTAQRVAAALPAQYKVSIVTLDDWRKPQEVKPGNHVATQVEVGGERYIIDATLGQIPGLSHYRQQVYIGPRSDWVAMMLQAKPVGLVTLKTVPVDQYRAPVATPELYPAHIGTDREVLRETSWYASSQSPYGLAHLERAMFRDQFAATPMGRWPQHGEALRAIDDEALKDLVNPLKFDRNAMGLRSHKDVKKDIGALWSEQDDLVEDFDGFCNDLVMKTPVDQVTELDGLIMKNKNLIEAAKGDNENRKKRLSGLLKRAIELQVKRQQLAQWSESERLSRGDVSVLAGRGLVNAMSPTMTPTSLQFTLLRHDKVANELQAKPFESLMLTSGGAYEGLLTSFDGSQVSSMEANVLLGHYWGGDHKLESRVKFLEVSNGRSGTVALKIPLAQMRQGEPLVITSGALSGCTMVYAQQGSDLYVFHTGQDAGDKAWHTGVEGVRNLADTVRRIADPSIPVPGSDIRINDDLGKLFKSFDQTVITYLGKAGTKINANNLPTNVRAFDYNRVSRPRVGRLGYSYALVYRDATGVHVRGLSEDTVMVPNKREQKVLGSMTWALKNQS